MAKEDSRVSVNTFEKYYKSYNHDDTTVTVSNGEAEMSFVVRHAVDLSTFGSAVVAAAKGCFKDGEYCAWMRDYAIRHVVIATYTNIRLPENPNKEFCFLMGTNVYDSVVEKIDPIQLDMLVVAVDEQIEEMAAKNNSSREQELDQAITMLNLVVQKYNEIIALLNSIMGDDIKQLAERLQNSAHDVTDEVAAVRERIESAKTTDKVGDDEIDGL